ncbi:helix-turn-helix domain-containing protein [Fusibacter sp. 3D3]|uniref:MerR family transcriptional regulator n=1 Tax=Fusibacter sp. 3D3 TaxID=1048380 RepID=UPI00085379D6|nr:helix-turn-helix domain-containing protein [Fusibacter sp. 3D3]GAU79516.1 transcriptional regulator [Fusibacter sp. 3D3]
MYSIGQFSMICNLNKKTLRYYDEIDLFKPVRIDETNQYRYYDESQIEIIREILRLKAIGIPLDQIKSILAVYNSAKPNEQLNAVYAHRLTAIERSIKQLKEQKALINHYLTSEASRDEKVISYSIEKGFFVEKGNLFYNSIDVNQRDLNAVISAFYESANGLKLTSGHIFRRSFDENMAHYDEIFAYTLENVKEGKIKAQPQVLSLKLVCDSIKNREHGYKQLFDHINLNGYVVNQIYEKYLMDSGRMHVEIIVSIE